MFAPSLRSVGVVLRKELVDALRDRRTLLTVLVSSVLLGPLVLVALSALVASLEASAERREVLAWGIEHGPTLVNFLRRQTFTVRAAPGDFEARLRDGRMTEPVLVIAPDFEAQLARGEPPLIEVVTDSARGRTDAAAHRLDQLVAAFARERRLLGLALRGVSPDLLEPVRVESRDLASAQTRAAQYTGMLPFFVLMAVLYGALHAALDTTAGERERGSLEPLLINPVERWTLVVGKWGAVAGVALLIAALASLGFIPAQLLLRSDTLAALVRYGMREAALFMVVLIPFAASLSALLMAVAIRSRSVKEAQASSAIVVLVVSLLPLFTLLSPGAEAAWHRWIPGLAQNLLMSRVLKGEAVGVADFAIPLAVAAVLAALALRAVVRSLRGEASR
jgi:sodium transport system permease protein